MFYVYDFGDISAQFRWEYDRFFYDRWCRESLAALQKHPERTDDPNEADFFVVAATLRCVSFAAVDAAGLARQAAGLPHRGTGKPHVFFDLRDGPKPLFHGPQVIVCKSAFHERYYDPRLGISIPQFPRYRFDRSVVPASQRRYLAGFKGNPRPQYGDLRTRLEQLHDGQRFVIRCRTLLPADLTLSASGEVREVVPPGEQSYEDILFDSTFALLPRACGYALSYRMIESLNAGCVPVILSDGYVLPFAEDLDYEQFSIRVAEADVEHLPEILEARKPMADSMQQNALNVYATHFASAERILHQTMHRVHQRVRR